MSSYSHFTQEEREYLQELLSKGHSMRKIADFLGRNVSSISREISRNRTKYKPRRPSNNKYQYNSWRAQCLAIHRRRQNRRYALVAGSIKYIYVVDKLSMYWSPEQIAKRLMIDHPGLKVGISTIYRYLKRNELPDVCVKKNLRRGGKRQNKKDNTYNTIHPDRIIPEWTKERKERKTIGHWEGDTVYGGIGKGALVTLVDRKTRLLVATIVDSRKANTTRLAIEKAMQGKVVKSISFDNGSEFSEFKDLEKNLNTLVYFAEPHKPWQRGTNENTNDIIRFFYPKGYNFHELSEVELQEVVGLINNRPRKCLNWKSPMEVYHK